MIGHDIKTYRIELDIIQYQRVYLKVAIQSQDG